MIQELILAILSAVGFVLSWNMTNLKAHALGLFVPSLRNKPVEQVEDEIDLRWGTFGELLNCPYCLSAWTGAALFGLYYSTPLVVSVAVSAFLIPPAAVHMLWSTPQARSDEAPAEAPSSDITYKAEGDYEFNAPQNINQRILAIKDDPQAHRKLITENTALIAMLHKPNDCPNPACEQLVKNYQAEVAHMEKTMKEKPGKCPSCTRGSIVNKYFYQLYDLLGPQKVNHLNPKMKTDAKDHSPFETTKDTPPATV